MKVRYTAEWYESDSCDDLEEFSSEITHSQDCETLTEAKAVSQRNALKHGVMVVGTVTAYEYSNLYGWEPDTFYTCEYFDDTWQDWGSEPA